MKISSPGFSLLNPQTYAHYLDTFSRLYPEDIVNAIPDADAWDWVRENIPFLDCPISKIEEIYYFRWWIYRKHIKATPDGYVVTEFLPLVGHGEKHNTINCPVGHHLYEGRWIKNPQYLQEYARFMLTGGGNLHSYSCWFADAVYKYSFVHPNEAYLTSLLDGLQAYFRKWQARETDGLFHYTPWMDGMEYSVSGNLEERFRPTLNAYMYADALAISKIAEMAGNAEVAQTFSAKSASLKANIQTRLWNRGLEFFATLDEDGNFTPVGNPVREAVGHIPWYFNLPDPGYEAAWKHLNDPEGFNTPVGLTSAEIRHPLFMNVNPERLASWDGAIWPYATSQTLVALQNLLRNYTQPYVTPADYVRELTKYAESHVLDGKPSIAEVLRDPFVRGMSGSEHYNHSTFADLVITGLAGLVPRADEVLEVSPLFPETWDYFCLDRARYRGRSVTIVWDRTGARYGEKGFEVWVDGEKRYRSNRVEKVELA
ncbi:MAG: glycoside hydrolase [Anaerolineales bacterium]|nr:glycoside hydrolase [Anaerolineales bacterium]